MTSKQWALANLTGKVLNRAMRAIEEQDTNLEGKRHSVSSLFGWLDSQDGPDYWHAIYKNDPNPDQYLPSDYVEAPEYVGEVENELPISKVVFFELVDNKYLASNGVEITTEFLLKHTHSIYHDSGYLIIDKNTNQ